MQNIAGFTDENKAGKEEGGKMRNDPLAWRYANVMLCRTKTSWVAEESC